MTPSTFSLRELISAVVLGIFVIALTIPIDEAAGRTSIYMQNMTQLRGVHQGLVIYAQSNKSWYPGLGKDTDPSVEKRYELLIQGDYTTPDYVISPLESDPMISAWSMSGAFTDSNYSFTMLQVPDSGARREEWKETLNSDSIVLADRNTSTYGYHNDRWVSKNTFGCTHSRHQPHISAGHWVGNVLWNDNHVEFLDNDRPNTQYDAAANKGDQLFEAQSDDDAYLIHTGN